MGELSDNITELYPGHAAEKAGLKVGDDVPATRPATQVQGEAVKDFEKGKVYVFECWATWCGPCIGAIPHLNELHKKLGPKGVVFTGVNVWDGEKDAKRNCNAWHPFFHMSAQGDVLSRRR